MADKFKACIVEGCNGNSIYTSGGRLGMCRAHQLRDHRHGSPTLGGPMRQRNVGKCSVAGCEGKARTRGWCQLHYERWSRNGDPLVLLGTPAGAAQSFFESTVLSYDGDDCLIWPFSRVAGYGALGGSHSKGTRSVSRMVCEKVNGSPPKSFDAAHTCGNGHLGCVAPKHIVWKSRKDNLADCVIHGTRRQGEKMHSAKLTEAEVREIRSRTYDTQFKLAMEFGVSQSAISLILNRKKWHHID